VLVKSWRRGEFVLFYFYFLTLFCQRTEGRRYNMFSSQSLWTKTQVFGLGLRSVDGSWEMLRASETEIEKFNVNKMVEQVKQKIILWWWWMSERKCVELWDEGSWITPEKKSGSAVVARKRNEKDSKKYSRT